MKLYLVMDTSENVSLESQAASFSSVMAPSTAAPSVHIALHPLVILNISEHWTRVKAQNGKAIQGLRVIFLAKRLNIVEFFLS